MDLYFDIGGTFFRCYTFNYDLFKELVKIEIEDNVLEQMKKYINLFLDSNIKIKNVLVSIAGIVDDNKIYGCMNAGLKDGTVLINNYNGIEVKYINDGDAFMLGEVTYNNIDYKRLNVLGIVFGTGVGCGLIVNGEIVKNVEIHKFFEKFLQNNNLTDENLDEVTEFISKDLSKIIELLNIDVLVINGYVNGYSNFTQNLKSKLTCNEFYFKKLKVINSNCKNSILIGLKNI